MRDIILIDNNQIVISNLFQSMKKFNKIDEGYLRHMILNSYRYYRSRFHSEYGELVICHDSPNCWRTDFYSQYKENRKKSRDNQNLDWNEVYSLMNTIGEEVKNTFPYKNIKIDRLEADDIIAILATRFHEQEKILIVSSDKDFQQLQIYPNVKQYSSMKKEFLDCENPKMFLLEHIISGDSSDGVPNILSDDDTFVNKDKRQKSCGKHKIESFVWLYENGELLDLDIQQRWERNEKMIDLSRIPSKYTDSVLGDYEKEPIGKRSKLLDYFIEKKLKNLIGSIQEF